MPICFVTVGLAARCSGMAEAAAIPAARIVEPAGGFSFLPPPGWQVQKKEGVKYRVCFAPGHGLVSLLSIRDAGTRLSAQRDIQNIITEAKANSPHLRVLSRGPFVTNSGLHGCRTMIEDRILGQPARLVFLSLPLAGSRRLMIFAAWPTSKNAQYAPAVDQSLKTFTLLR